ncbi:MAG: excisionase family DNA-binding protein [Deltaproteobacteria bacterium]|jgi:excisionase family DNA binding protein|nr:excisionase family DNA-binding protein [Deltaproteobacteria bacterium]
MADERLNWQQACKLLGCSKSHFYNLVNSGEIPAERSGKVRMVRVRKEDCERYRKQWQARQGQGEDQEG